MHVEPIVFRLLKATSLWATVLLLERRFTKLSSLLCRKQFLNSCRDNNIIPKFLQFRLPPNGAFDDKIVESFQLKCLDNERRNTSSKITTTRKELENINSALRCSIAEVCTNRLRTVLWRNVVIPAVVSGLLSSSRLLTRDLHIRHSVKLQHLSELQQKPLFSVDNTVQVSADVGDVPRFVIDTLKLGPKHPVSSALRERDVMRLQAEIERALELLRMGDTPIAEAAISEVGLTTLRYVRHIKKCSGPTAKSAIKRSANWLHTNDCVAVPFDKGIGFYVMTRTEYVSKLSTVTSGTQFIKVTDPQRRNAINVFKKEDDRIFGALQSMVDDDELTKQLYRRLSPHDSQPARLYGLAKVHKADTPLRPVLATPGSAYEPLDLFVSSYLRKLPETTMPKVDDIRKRLCSGDFSSECALFSLDVKSLFTNVPLDLAITMAADRLYATHNAPDGVSQHTFQRLIELAVKDVMFDSAAGKFLQCDGVAMGSHVGPQLANIVMSMVDEVLAAKCELYVRYVDDILCVSRHDPAELLSLANSVHPNLQHTMELTTTDGTLAFLDMNIHWCNGVMRTEHYRKPSDTGLMLNYHSRAPTYQKRAAVSGSVYRAWFATSSFDSFHKALEQNRCLWRKNCYPSSFTDPIESSIITRLLTKPESSTTDFRSPVIFVPYINENTSNFKSRIESILDHNATVVMTTTKLRSVLPPLKPKVPTNLLANVVYKFTCPHCSAGYVGYTCRHFSTRLTEHTRPSCKTAVFSHLRESHGLHTGAIKADVVDNTAICERGRDQLTTAFLEAIIIAKEQPALNRRNEFRDTKHLLLRAAFTTA